MIVTIIKNSEEIVACFYGCVATPGKNSICTYCPSPREQMLLRLTSGFHVERLLGLFFISASTNFGKIIRN